MKKCFGCNKRIWPWQKLKIISKYFVPEGNDRHYHRKCYENRVINYIPYIKEEQ